MPEGLFPLAHSCLYLASCPKSNAVKRAITSARASIEERGALPVPLKLRNPVTRLMQDEGYGADYRYPHDYEGNVIPGERYLPDELGDAQFYEPSNQGLEADIQRRLAAIRKK
jgi:putative ATPase